MSGYDGPSFYKQTGKDKVDDLPAKRSSETLDEPYRPILRQQQSLEQRAKKPSLKEVAMERASKLRSKRSSTPYNPTKLPSKAYFDKRFEMGQPTDERLYRIIARRLKKPTQMLLLFEHRLKEDNEESDDDSASKEKKDRHGRYRSGLNPDISQILQENERSKERIIQQSKLYESSDDGESESLKLDE